MTMEAERIDQPTKDPVSNVLKWVLLIVAVAVLCIQLISGRRAI